ncbi:hypothetical protein FB567DRAFT_30681 [Paraphoma chrysanthemicola]|uniref:Uncharacterized protein n=1 Tax=Paraphoma chrysanthemicola TaxID=798071 RepID=A0A8K0RII8_9PLEO|nr:hypothetical protein FB567DRAFT_30681 [Paraphoma chrysanthemicola]
MYRPSSRNPTDEPQTKPDRHRYRSVVRTSPHLRPSGLVVKALIELPNGHCVSAQSILVLGDSNLESLLSWHWHPWISIEKQFGKPIYQIRAVAPNMSYSLQFPLNAMSVTCLGSTHGARAVGSITVGRPLQPPALMAPTLLATPCSYPATHFNPLSVPHDYCNAVLRGMSVPRKSRAFQVQLPLNMRQTPSQPDRMSDLPRHSICMSAPRAGSLQMSSRMLSAGEKDEPRARWYTRLPEAGREAYFWPSRFHGGAPLGQQSCMIRRWTR